VNAGSVLETDDQRGLGAFQETHGVQRLEHFKPGELVRFPRVDRPPSAPT
jgi:hypothetical protein